MSGDPDDKALSPTITSNRLTIDPSRKRVLVIDDDAMHRELCAEVLRGDGYAVFEASNGREGIERLTQVVPDLVLCDVRMPELNGFEALDLVRAMPEFRRIPFVLLSGVGVSVRDIRRGMNQGADDYLVKPFTPDELLAAVRVRLERATPTPMESAMAQIARSDASSDHGRLLDQAPLLGRFRLDRVLGVGGMATVYAATDLASGRTVAIKVALDEDGTKNARLSREAHVLEALDDPHIVPLVTYGRAGERLTFIAMEWIDGPSLATYLTWQRPALVDVLQISERIALALAAAHAHGILHRDVKPSNVVLRDAEPTRAMLLDFGLATLPSASPLTAEGALLGTLGYMSPEQILGRAQLDARTDLFSLGCVIYEMITGVTPFSTDSSIAAVSSVLFDVAPSLQLLAPEVPDALDALVSSMLARQPHDRPESAAAVADALRALREAVEREGN